VDATAARAPWLSPLLWPAFGVIAALLVAPLAVLVFYSLWRYVPGRITDHTWTFENYARLFSDGFYLGVLWQTVQLGLVVVLLSLLLGFPTAFFLARTRSRLKPLLVYLVFVPMMISLVVRAYGWIVLLGYNGVVNGVLLGLGIIDMPIRMLGNGHAVALALVEVLLPFMVLPLVTALEAIPRSVEEAARVLGAGRWQVFRRVILPLAAPGIVSGSLMVFSLAMTAYALPALVGGGQVKMISALAYDAILVSYNWPFGSAVGVLMVVASTLLILGYLRLVPGGRG
jgi:putative spermidine/putrescine transport system permease protein